MCMSWITKKIQTPWAMTAPETSTVLKHNTQMIFIDVLNNFSLYQWQLQYTGDDYENAD